MLCQVNILRKDNTIYKFDENINCRKKKIHTNLNNSREMQGNATIIEAFVSQFEHLEFSALFVRAVCNSYKIWA